MPRGFFGIGVEHIKTAYNIGTLWRSADLMGASFIFTIGKRYSQQSSDTMKSHKHIPLFNFETFADLKNHLPFGCKMIGIELDNKAIPLHSYCHPERACYLLGAEDHGLTKEAISLCHDLIVLPGRFSMNVAVAGSIVIYDRITRSKYQE